LRIECLYSLASMLNKHGVESWHVDHIIPLQGKMYLECMFIATYEYCQARKTWLKAIDTI